nr:MAG TPA: hypothetical protein [Caudoviricetes sp.]
MAFNFVQAAIDLERMSFRIWWSRMSMSCNDR